MNEPIHVVCPHCDVVNRVPPERLGQGGSCGRCKRALFEGQPVELNARNFDVQISRSDLPVVVDFWAPWCGPCKQMAPHFARAAGMLEPQVRLAKLDTEAEPALGARYGIRSIPTVVMFRRGQELARQSGAMDADTLASWVRAAGAGVRA